jgi:hypothetical protein
VCAPNNRPLPFGERDQATVRVVNFERSGVVGMSDMTAVVSNKELSMIPGDLAGSVVCQLRYSGGLSTPAMAGSEGNFALKITADAQS